MMNQITGMVRPLSPTHLRDVKTAAMRVRGMLIDCMGPTDGERNGLNLRNLTPQQILHYQNRHLIPLNLLNNTSSEQYSTNFSAPKSYDSSDKASIN